MIKEGYIWRSVFIPADKLGEFQALVAKWKSDHQGD